MLFQAVSRRIILRLSASAAEQFSGGEVERWQVMTHDHFESMRSIWSLTWQARPARD